MHCLELGKLDLNRSVASLGLLISYHHTIRLCNVSLDPKIVIFWRPCLGLNSQPFYYMYAHLVSLARMEKMAKSPSSLHSNQLAEQHALDQPQKAVYVPDFNAIFIHLDR